MLLGRGVPTSKDIAYRNYLLTVLLLVLSFNYVDRLALGLVMQDIKTDLSLSDTQLGLLTGIAFALFYSVMGIPIARWADRGNRVTIISITAALWSVAVTLCGIATSFAQLLLIRVGVAVGEAGCVPPAHSLIADHFSREERPRAFARYMLGAPLSCLVGYFLAGWINEKLGWRATFMIIGLPGLLLALVAWLTLKEPRRAGGVESPVPDREAASVTQVLLTLWRTRTFRHLLLGFSITYFFGYGISQWQPTFFVRSFGLGTGELGLWFTLISGVIGTVGTYAGGEWAARRASNNEGLQLGAVAAGYALFAVLSALTYVAPSYYAAFALMGVMALGVFAANGPLFATIQTLVPAHMRAMSIATIYLFANLIGMGLGPLTVGIVSDALRPVFGDESLRFALLAVSPGYLWCAWHFWRARATVARDLIPPT